MESSYAERVAASVRAEMARQKVTQVQVAAALGVSQVSVSRRLSGTVPFDAEEIGVLAALLDVPVAVLFGEVVA